MNALPNVNIIQKNYKFYLNGEKWDGNKKEVVKFAEYKNIYLEKMKENGKAREDVKRYLEIKNMSTEKFLEEVVLV